MSACGQAPADSEGSEPCTEETCGTLLLVHTWYSSAFGQLAATLMIVVVYDRDPKAT